MDLNQAREIGRLIEAQDASLDNQEELGEAVPALCDHWLEVFPGEEMKGQMGAPDWSGYELRVWKLGESLRLLLKKKKGWRGRGPLLDAAARILSRREFGKGRQTFALLLGEFGQGAYADGLGAVLGDPEVWGHAIKALTKGKIRGYAGEVAAVEAQETGWVRSAARKYLQAFAQNRDVPDGGHVAFEVKPTRES